jgi:hypothetical protein
MLMLKLGSWSFGGCDFVPRGVGELRTRSAVTFMHDGYKTAWAGPALAEIPVPLVLAMRRRLKSMALCSVWPDSSRGC